MKKILKHNYRIALIITSLVSFTSLFFSTRFFIYENAMWYDYLQILIYWTVLLISVFFTTNHVIKFIYNLFYSNYKDEYKRKLLFFSIFILYGILILIIVWPGGWVWDEYYMIGEMKNFIFSNRNSYITIIFYSSCIMLFPSAITIVLSQIFLISSVYTFVINKIYEHINNKKLIWISFSILFLPVIAFNIVYPFRIPLYCHLELYFLTFIFFKYMDKESFKVKDYIICFICITLLSLWRSEGIYYLLFPFLIYFSFKIKFKYCIALFTSIIIAMMPLKIVEMIDRENTINYKLAVYINPLSNMLQYNLNNQELLDEIDKVLDVKLLKDNPSIHDIPVYFKYGKQLVKSHDQKDISNLTKAFTQLVTNNLDIFLKIKYDTFLSANGLKYKYNNQINIKKMNYEDYLIRNITNMKFSKPINNISRYKFMRFIIGYNKKSPTSSIIYKTWNSIPSILFLLIILVGLVLKRKFVNAFILLFCLVRVPLIFITAPASFFMYYLSVYIISFFVLNYLIIKFFDKKEELYDI